MIWFVMRGMFVCAPPKCGGTALYRAAFGIGNDVSDRDVFSTAKGLTTFFEADEVMSHGLPALMAVRDPVSRFGSLWRDKCRGADVNYPQLTGLSPSALMDFIAANPESDIHWRPQATLYREGVHLVDYRGLFARLQLPPVEANATAAMASDPELPVARIVAHYREDAALVAKLC